MLKNYNVNVIEKELKGEMLYKDTLVLTYSIKYPQFSSERFIESIKKINKYYKDKALEYQYYVRTKLYKMAIDQYEYSVANGFPIMQYEAVTAYTITLNENCALSLYYDQYEFTGGAHGGTVRMSDSWSLLSGKKITLDQLFPYNKNYIVNILKEINKQIEKQISEGNNIYFEDYSKLLVETFNPNSFYLTPNALGIYYQQYDIAPYSSGIPFFEIPYNTVGAVPPKCW